MNELAYIYIDFSHAHHTRQLVVWILHIRESAYTWLHARVHTSIET